MDVSVVIVNFRSKKKTLRCLESLYISHWDGISHEIIVVDNCSDDDIQKDLGMHFPDVVFIQSTKNLGMGGGNNIGIKKASGKFVLILNPDTVVDQNAIKVLFSYINENKDVGIVGPKLLNQDGTLQYSCLRFPSVYTPIFRRTILGNFAKKHLEDYLMKDRNHNTIMDVDWMLGSCLMIRKNCFGKTQGSFDEGFFMYFEDTDLCRRFHESGFRVVYNPSSLVVHDHMRASADNQWYFAIFKNKLVREHIKSWIRYFMKWGIKRIH